MKCGCSLCKQITEGFVLKGDKARSFIEKQKNPPYNKAREETIKRAKEIMEKRNEN